MRPDRSFARLPRRFVASSALAASLTAAGPAVALELFSESFDPGGTLDADQVYAGFGCSGANRSPALEIRDVPEGTKSLAITAYDPDAPTGSGWWHWVLIDLPIDATRLAEGVGTVGAEALPPEARQLRNDFGTRDFGGACPPAGASPHRYVFTAHALDVPTLEIPDDSSAALAGFMLGAHAIETDTLEAMYGR